MGQPCLQLDFPLGQTTSFQKYSGHFHIFSCIILSLSADFSPLLLSMSAGHAGFVLALTFHRCSYSTPTGGDHALVYKTNKHTTLCDSSQLQFYLFSKLTIYFEV